MAGHQVLEIMGYRFPTVSQSHTGLLNCLCFAVGCFSYADFILLILLILPRYYRLALDEFSLFDICRIKFSQVKPAAKLHTHRGRWDAPFGGMGR
jgi:hypothetical protein